MYLWYYNVQQLLKIVITQVYRINFPTDCSTLAIKNYFKSDEIFLNIWKIFLLHDKKTTKVASIVLEILETTHNLRQLTSSGMWCQKLKSLRHWPRYFSRILHDLHCDLALLSLWYEQVAGTRPKIFRICAYSTLQTCGGHLPANCHRIHMQNIFSFYFHATSEC